jgi:murein DD-endopeptidase MepM/ murein hydrolase activator NlpD
VIEESAAVLNFFYPELALHNRRLWPVVFLLMGCVLLAVFSSGCARGRHRGLPLPPFASEETPSIWPVEHAALRISSPYGEVRSGGRRHKGIDMAVPQGTPVVATASGETTFSGQQGAYGNIVIIRHGKGFETAYAHLQRCMKRAGEWVLRGDRIGLVGATGNATGPHLHYEVRRDGVPVDPQPWLP